MDCGTILLAVGSILMGVAAGFGLWRLGPLWDMLAARQMGALGKRFEHLGGRPEKLQTYLRIWGIAVIGVFGLLGPVLSMYPLAVIATALVYVAPRHILDYLIQKRSWQLSNQMVSATSTLANSVKAGLSIAQGMEALATAVPMPLAAELRRIVLEYQRGRPIREAIDQVRRRLDSEAFSVFALAIDVALDRGGRLNEALDRIGHSLQENDRLRRKMEADTAAGYQAILMLAWLPVVFLGVVQMLKPDALFLLFHTVIGQLFLSATAFLIYLGLVWAWRIMHVEC